MVNAYVGVGLGVGVGVGVGVGAGVGAREIVMADDVPSAKLRLLCVF